MSLSSGTQLGPYEIVSLIGVGGMGEIYRARDPRVGRDVAIKVLATSYSQDAKRLERFEQEARTASLLNHPNIITLFDVGVQDRSPYLVTELLLGTTLRNRLTEGPITLRKVIDFSTQIAQGLSAAHEKGIIHRDLKPENLFLTKEGRVKILDFGVAKLTHPEEMSDDLTKVSTLPRQTEEGIVLGTILYMSPEQVRGKKLDHRSDIFSFGTILYEMLAGKNPFYGKSNMEVIHSVLEVDPPGLQEINPMVPPALERIVFRCLDKNPENRFQSTSDLSFALEAVSIASASGASGALKPTHKNLKKYFVGSILTIAAFLFIIIMSATRGKLFTRPAPNTRQIESFQKMKITRLTSIGKVSDAAISPDGKYMAYVVNEEGTQSLWVRQVSAMNNVLIVPPASVNYEGVTFSSDGNFLYYMVTPQDQPKGSIYQIPVLGGPVRRLIDDAYSAVAISPDNKSLAFIGSSALMISDVDGHEIRKVARPADGKSFGASPAWAPDGKKIAVVLQDAAGYQDTLVAIDVENRKQFPIGSTTWFDVHRLKWLLDGTGLVLAAKDQGTGYRNYQIWHVSYPTGRVSRITNDLNDYRGLSLSIDQGSLITVRLEQTSSIWILKDLNSEPKQITHSTVSLEGLWGVSWTGDDRIVYTSIASGNEDLWVMTADGKSSKQIVANDTAKIAPSCCPDGQSMVFMSRGKGGTRVWRIGMDGNRLLQLTDGPSEGVPVCSADSKWAIYVSGGDQRWSLWKIPIDGGHSVQLTDRPSLTPAVSPDGKLIAYAFLNDRHQKMIGIISSEGGSTLKTLPLPPTVLVDVGVGLHWTNDSQALAYIDTLNGVSNLWIQPLDGSAAKKITNFDSEEIFSYDLSRDGKIAVTRGTLTQDVVLIKDFR